MKCQKCDAENPETSRFCGSCAAPLESLEPTKEAPAPSSTPPLSKTKTFMASIKDIKAGTTFAKRYHIIEEIGRGGMGTVYKAVDTKIDEKVALKLLNHEIAAEEKTTERFQNELKLARNISHRNVCRMYDFSESEGTPFITMEYISGEDLKSLIRRIGQLTIGKAVFIARQICEGLAEAHRLGVVHRDLKPQNIMIDREGDAKIMDFGIARSLESKGLTDTGVIIGTPEYMSPEAVEGRETGPGSDIYSLGIILYEMLTGRPPFEGETPLSVAVKQKTAPPPDPRSSNAHVSDRLSRIILKCLEKDRKKRYLDADELLTDLTAVEKGMPATEKIRARRTPITSREITVKFKLKKLFVPAAAVLAIIISAVVLWQRLTPKRAAPLATDKPSLAVMHFENNTGDETYDHWRKALSDLLISDLSQSKYISVLSGERLYNIIGDMNLLDARSFSSENLKEIASRGGVENILVGKLTMAGDTFRINTQVQEANTGILIGSESVEGEGESSLFSMVDDLTKKIKGSFKLSAEQIASDLDQDAGVITTSSPEALKYYTEGMKFHEMGEFSKSIPLMEMAVALDPEFAMALRTAATDYYNLGFGAEAKEKLGKALLLVARLSERERYQIEGISDILSEKNKARAIEAYKKLLELYPEDSTGNNNLGALFIREEQWDKAMERFKVLIDARSESVLHYQNLAIVFNAKGLYEEAKEALESYVQDFQDNKLIYQSLSMTYLNQGKLDLAAEEVNKAFALDPPHYSNDFLRGDIYLYKGNFADAEKEYLKLLETDEPAAHNLGFRRLWALHLLKGNLEESMRHAERGAELGEMLGEIRWEAEYQLFEAYLLFRSGQIQEALEITNLVSDKMSQDGIFSLQRRALHLRGVVQVELDDIEGAKVTADEIKALVDAGMNKNAMRYYHHLLGMIALNGRDYEAALVSAQKAVDLLPDQNYDFTEQAFFVEALAKAYRESDDMDRARVEYRKIAEMTIGRINYGDIYNESVNFLKK
jgi:serine/threonine protein kinase/Flp pilus assembly protein TadD